MSWLHAARARARLLFARRAAESRIDDEIRFHIEMESARLAREEGLAPAEARRRALATFGGIERHRESLRDGRGLAWLGGMSLDFRLGGRMLVKYPGLTLVGGFALAFAICIGAGVFEILTQAFSPALPFPEGDRIVAIRNWDAAAGRVESRIAHDFAAWRRDVESVDDLGAFRLLQRNLITGSGAGEPIEVAEISASAFRVAAVAPLMGRTLLEDDERAGAPPVVVIGEAVWRSRLAADPEVLGREVRLGGDPFTVVGVLPEGYGFPIANSVWVPLRLGAIQPEPREGPPLTVFGRLADGVSISQARSELATLGRRTAAEFQGTHEHLRPQVVPYAAAILTMVLGISLGDELDPATLATMIRATSNVPLVLFALLVFGNVALLVFARAVSRETELVVRTALGASRARLIAQLFAEALVLGGVAAVVGLVAARLVIQLPIAMLHGGRLPFWIDGSLSPATVMYAVGLTVLCAVVAGVLPALKVTRGLAGRLRQVSAGGGGFRFGGIWTAVIIAQIAVTVPFPLALFAVRAESAAIRAVETGIAEAEYLTVRIQMDRDSWLGSSADTSAEAFGARLRRSLHELERRLEQDPGVTAVTFANRLPHTYHPYRLVEVDEGAAAPLDPRWPGYRVSTADVDADYFDVLGVPILSGRAFHAGDLEPGARTVIVNQSFVHNVLGGQNPLGRRLRYMRFEESDDDAHVSATEPWYEIVGVVRDLGFAYGTDPKVGGFYHAAAPATMAPIRMAVHARADAASLGPRVRELAAEVDPSLRVHAPMLLGDIVKEELRFYRFWTWFVVIASAVALLLSLAGIYAIMSFTVAQRTREIGIRVALGADRSRVTGAIFRRPLQQVALGILAGGALLAVALTESDVALTLGSAAAFTGYLAVMMAVCLLAAIVPTRRALAVQPSEALRWE